MRNSKKGGTLRQPRVRDTSATLGEERESVFRCTSTFDTATPLRQVQVNAHRSKSQLQHSCSILLAHESGTCTGTEEPIESGVESVQKVQRLGSTYHAKNNERTHLRRGEWPLKSQNRCRCPSETGQCRACGPLRTGFLSGLRSPPRHLCPRPLAGPGQGKPREVKSSHEPVGDGA